MVALHTVEPHIVANAISLFQSPQPPPIETVLTLLLNDLSAMSMHVMLVLDDYHVIDTRGLHDGMVFLLDLLPPRLHLVIANRADPVLPLARLRARRTDRAPSRRSALYPRRGCGVPQRSHGPASDGARGDFT